jgi:hypothetical protein
MWLLEQRVVLTKENILKRNWQGNPDCYFCGAPESKDHLFFSCPIAKVAWDVVAFCFKQRTSHVTYDQYWVWIKARCWEWQSFIGQFGKLEIELVLRRN